VINDKIGATAAQEQQWSASMATELSLSPAQYGAPLVVMKLTPTPTCTKALLKMSYRSGWPESCSSTAAAQSEADQEFS